MVPGRGHSLVAALVFGHCVNKRHQKITVSTEIKTKEHNDREKKPPTLSRRGLLVSP